MKLEEIVPALKEAGLTFIYAYGRESIRSNQHFTPGSTELSPLACLLKLKLLSQGLDVGHLNNINVQNYISELDLSRDDLRCWMIVEDIAEYKGDPGFSKETHKKLRRELETITKGKKPEKKKSKKVVEDGEG